MPSGITPRPCVARIATHRLVLRLRQYSHCRHSGVYSGMTWSPFFSDVTPAPTSATMPAPSWPRMAGNSPSGSAPDSVYSSVWQMPVALISTSTSPARGPSTSTVSRLSGLPASRATAARTFIASLPCGGDYCFFWPSSPNCSRYAITFFRFVASFRPGKIILVCGTTVCGDSRYLSSSSGVQVMPESLFAGEYS